MLYVLWLFGEKLTIPDYKHGLLIAALRYFFRMDIHTALNFRILKILGWEEGRTLRVIDAEESLKANDLSKF